MPTNNKFTKVITTKILPITVAVVVAVAANACKPEPDNTPPVRNCTCIEKEHDALCECDAEAGRCDCTVKMNEMLENGKTRIWKETGVSVEDYNAMVAAFNLGYTLTTTQKNNFANNIKEIRVKPAGTAISHDGAVLVVACDTEWNPIVIYLLQNGLLSQAQRSVRDTIGLSKANGGARWRWRNGGSYQKS